MDNTTAATSSAIEHAAELTGLSQFWIAILARLIAIVVIVLIAYALYRLIMYPLRKVLDKEDTRRGGSIFRNIVRITMSVWAIATILDICFDVDIAGILGALGIVGVAVSLGAQQTIANLIGGIIISLSETLAPGDWVVIGNTKEAEIIDTNWRLTILRDEDNVEYAVPNSKMVSEIVAKKNPFYTIVVPFSLKTTTPDVEGLLVDCEQAILDCQVEKGMDSEKRRPKAHVAGASVGAIQAEVKIYVARDFDTRAAERAILPALVNLLQERDALVEVAVAGQEA